MYMARRAGRMARDPTWQIRSKRQPRLKWWSISIASRPIAYRAPPNLLHTGTSVATFPFYCPCRNIAGRRLLGPGCRHIRHARPARAAYRSRGPHEPRWHHDAIRPRRIVPERIAGRRQAVRYAAPRGARLESACEPAAKPDSKHQYGYSADAFANHSPNIGPAG